MTRTASKPSKPPSSLASISTTPQTSTATVIARSCSGGSLARLETDHVEVIQCHIPHLEPNTPVFIEGFRKLKDDGVAEAWGVSTGDVEVLGAFNADGDCDVLQTDYSIMNRTAERELLPYCNEHGIGGIVRGPLAMGLLTDKFS